MAITKKGNSLRNKSAARIGANPKLSNKIAELKDNNNDIATYHENPLLKLSKITKKEKQSNKSKTFNDQLQGKVTFNLGSGISKSALRRRKRKDKEQLKPKMNDLLSSLPESTINLVEALDDKEDKKTTDKVHESRANKFINTTKKTTNAPNAAKQSGHAKILTTEHKNFNRVLQDNQFRASPFAALKNAISHNIQNSN